jgi:Trk K+ transport system NAD-binding subunit
MAGIVEFDSDDEEILKELNLDDLDGASALTLNGE